MRKIMYVLLVVPAFLGACKSPDPAGISGKYVSNLSKQTITISASADGKYTVTLAGDKIAVYKGGIFAGDTLKWSDGSWGGHMTFKGKTATSSVDRWATYQKIE